MRVNPSPVRSDKLTDTVSSADDVTLKRELGLPSGVCFTVGIIIGTLMLLFCYALVAVGIRRFGNLRVTEGRPGRDAVRRPLSDSLDSMRTGVVAW